MEIEIGDDKEEEDNAPSTHHGSDNSDTVDSIETARNVSSWFSMNGIAISKGGPTTVPPSLPPTPDKIVSSDLPTTVDDIDNDIDIDIDRKSMDVDLSSVMRKEEISNDDLPAMDVIDTDDDIDSESNSNDTVISPTTQVMLNHLLAPITATLYQLLAKQGQLREEETPVSPAHQLLPTATFAAATASKVVATSRSEPTSTTTTTTTASNITDSSSSSSSLSKNTNTESKAGDEDNSHPKRDNSTGNSQGNLSSSVLVVDDDRPDTTTRRHPVEREEEERCSIIDDLQVNDVLCGQGSRSNKHRGNIKFCQLIASRCQENQATNSHGAKGHIALNIAHVIVRQRGGRLLKQVEGGSNSNSNSSVSYQIQDKQTLLKKIKQTLTRYGTRYKFKLQSK